MGVNPPACVGAAWGGVAAAFSLSAPAQRGVGPRREASIRRVRVHGAENPRVHGAELSRSRRSPDKRVGLHVEGCLLDAPLKADDLGGYHHSPRSICLQMCAPQNEAIYVLAAQPKRFLLQYEPVHKSRVLIKTCIRCDTVRCAPYRQTEGVPGEAKDTIILGAAP